MPSARNARARWLIRPAYRRHPSAHAVFSLYWLVSRPRSGAFGDIILNKPSFINSHIAITLEGDRATLVTRDDAGNEVRVDFPSVDLRQAVPLDPEADGSTEDGAQ